LHTFNAFISTKKVALSQAPAKAKIIKEPYGTVLIMAPWNYPFQLCMVPLIGAIAAGNTAVVKPSAYAPAVSNAVCSVISEAFPPEYVSVVEGGREENNALLEQHFDYIFFTGSPAVGKTVMQQAANNLTPVTLELGGKSPVIAEQSADIKKTAKRILFGKLLNAGQTCVAPDYLLVQNSIKAELINEIKNHYNTMIPDTKYKRENFPKIINKKHFDRIRQLMETQDILIGGNTYPDTLQIEFTLVNEPDTESSLMQEEIFGPVLPVIGFDDINEAVNSFKLEIIKGRTYLNPESKYIAPISDSNASAITDLFVLTDELTADEPISIYLSIPNRLLTLDNDSSHTA
jgi:aldehyde dehydrogenase (NAD+)